MMDNTKKISVLVLSASAGIGHLKAADALVQASRRYFPHVQITSVDVLDLAPALFKRFYAGSYLNIVRDHPLLWAYMYHMTDRDRPHSFTDRIRRFIERFLIRKTWALIKDIKPDHIICTHFMPVQVLSHYSAAGMIDMPVWVQITDFDCHLFWIDKGMSGYFVGNQEVLHRLSGRGITSQSVHVTGIPVDPSFSDSVPREQAAAEIHINPSLFTFLMMFGGFGVNRMDHLAEQLLALGSDFQVVTIAGRNQDLYQRLKNIALKYPGRIHPVGFTDAIRTYMAASDCAVTKAGGLTTSECLAAGLPMLIVSPIAGQEERNTDYLIEQGAAVKAVDASCLFFKAAHLLKNRSLLDGMRKHISRIEKPHAARDILNIILTGSG